jgi:hypothetical protein
MTDFWQVRQCVFLEELMMKRFEKNLTSTFVILAVLLSFSASNSAYANLLDLNDFFADPTVTVSLDGLTATFAEDPFLTPVLLSNDPGLGDPHVILPEIGGVGQILFFDFDFVEAGAPSINHDEFGAFIIDKTGLSAGPGFEFFTDATSSGTVSFHLSSLSGPTYEPLGLQFQLSALFGDVDLDSTLTISNVQLVPVPVPGAVLLGILGLGVAGVKLRRFA